MAIILTKPLKYLIRAITEAMNKAAVAQGTGTK